MVQNLNIAEVTALLSRNYLGHLSYSYMNSPFVVPMTYFYDAEEEALIGYTSKGHKTSCMELNPSVAVLIEEIDALHKWKSVVVHGKYEVLSGSTAKAALHKFCQGLNKLVDDVDDDELKFLCDFSSKSDSEEPPIVYRIKVDEYTAKERC